MDGLCRARFDEFLSLEFSDPAYGQVHHLTVATYMLQHSSQLTREGWIYERELLKAFLVENRSPSSVRHQSKRVLDSGKRTFRIKSKDNKPVISKSSWSRTILDVRSDDPRLYCQDVTAWAKSVLDEIGSESF